MANNVASLVSLIHDGAVEDGREERVECEGVLGWFAAQDRQGSSSCGILIECYSQAGYAPSFFSTFRAQCTNFAPAPRGKGIGLLSHFSRGSTYTTFNQYEKLANVEWLRDVVITLAIEDHFALT